MFKSARPLLFALCLGVPLHPLAETRLAQPLPDSQSLVIENNNLSASDFFAAFMSKNMMERRYAQMYLVGVLDATEGNAWCDYHRIKTISLNEAVYEGLKNAEASQLRKRAALVITDILKKDFSCKEKHK
ncbi:Rap1a/Tai family immunity protein [Azonexus sp.]|uniref:Rap1a/Tai family immunity protein n=1 Tax=Azonexus sp. TaxID=1872668 RepID=UPI0035AF4489